MNTLKLISDELYIFWEYCNKKYKLGSSKLNKDLDVRIQDNIFLLIMPDYVEYVNSGRKAGAKMPPVEAIADWCRSKGIPSDNQTIWKIRKSIAEDGIKPKPILNMLFDLVENEWESDWMSLKEAAILFNEIANNPEDENQIECSLWSDIDNKDLMRYSNIENKYYSC